MSGEQPVFLERKGYRQRRLMDAVRLLPVIGFALWMIPLLWNGAAKGTEDAAPTVSSALMYIFGVWGLLVLGALALWSRTKGSASGTARDEDG